MYFLIIQQVISIFLILDIGDVLCQSEFVSESEVLSLLIAFLITAEALYRSVPPCFFPGHVLKGIGIVSHYKCSGKWGIRLRRTPVVLLLPHWCAFERSGNAYLFHV